MEININFIYPVLFCFFQYHVHFSRRIVFLKKMCNWLFAFLCAKKNDIVCFFAGSERNFLKTKGSHCFFSGCTVGRRYTRMGFIYCAWMCIGAALTDEILDGRIKGLWCLAAARASGNIINSVVYLMATFIKRHSRAYKNTMLCRLYAMEHRSNIAVITYIVRTAAVKRNSGIGSDVLCAF